MWIQVVLDFLRQFWPFEIVYSYQRAVRFWNGAPLRELKTGLHLFFPFFGHIQIEDAKPDVLRLFKQNVTTKDGVGLMVSANLRWELTSLLQAITNVQDHKDNLADEARTALSRVVREKTYAELLDSQKTVETKIAAEMRKVVEAWGITIHRVSIVDFIKTRSIALANI